MILDYRGELKLTEKKKIYTFLIFFYIFFKIPMYYYSADFSGWCVTHVKPGYHRGNKIMFSNLVFFGGGGGGYSRQPPPALGAQINSAYLSKPQFSIVCVGGWLNNRLTPSLRRTWRRFSCYIVGVYHLLFHPLQIFLIQGSYPNVDIDMGGVLKPHVRSWRVICIFS